MKKFLSVLLVMSMLLTLAACSSKKGADGDEATATTGAGEVVTLENGETVSQSGDNAAQGNDAGNDNGGSAANGETTTKINTTKPTTAKPTTTAAPTKRRVTITVKIPYSLFGQKMTIRYKQSDEDDSKYRELVKDELINLEQVTYSLDGEFLGDVDVYVAVTGGTPLFRNFYTIGAYEANGVIDLVTSSEQLDGGED